MSLTFKRNPWVPYYQPSPPMSPITHLHPGAYSCTMWLDPSPQMNGWWLIQGQAHHLSQGFEAITRRSNLVWASLLNEKAQNRKWRNSHLLLLMSAEKLNKSICRKSRMQQMQGEAEVGCGAEYGYIVENPAFPQLVVNPSWGLAIFQHSRAWGILRFPFSIKLIHMFLNGYNQ